MRRLKLTFLTSLIILILVFSWVCCHYSLGIKRMTAVKVISAATKQNIPKQKM